MRHSNMLDSLFYEHTILCESDSDCKLYSLMLEYIKAQAGEWIDTLFIHCGGKGRMHLIIEELKALGVDYRVIPDIDVFNDRNLIRMIVETSGGEWNTFEHDYSILANAMNQPSGTKTPGEFVEAIRGKIAERGFASISKAEAKRISRDIKELLENQWDTLKHQGMGYIRERNTWNALSNMVTALNNLNVYPVKVGELENFIPQVGNHGPGWVMSVIANYPDFGSPVYDEIRGFVESWRL